MRKRRFRDLAHFLQTIRSECGLSKTEAANKARISLSYLSELESGKKSHPSQEVLYRLARIYNRSPYEMLARAGRVVQRDLFPKFDEKSHPEEYVARMTIALQDPGFWDLAEPELPDKDISELSDQEWLVAFRKAEINAYNNCLMRVSAAFGDSALRWGSVSKKRVKKIPIEVQYFIADLYFRYDRCRAMYRNLWESRGLGPMPKDWV